MNWALVCFCVLVLGVLVGAVEGIALLEQGLLESPKAGRAAFGKCLFPRLCSFPWQ